MDIQHKILIVDDEQNILNALKRVLRKTDFVVIQALGGREGIRAIDREEDLAVVVSDLRMPEIDGLGVLSHALEKRPDATRIAITGQADMDLIMGVINTGNVSQFLVKPWQEVHFLAVMKGAVEAYSMRHKNRQLEQMNVHHIEVLKQFRDNLENEVKDRTGQLELAKTRIEKTLRDVVRAFSNIMEIQSPGLRGHVTRVGDMSRALALQMGQDLEEVDHIEIAARLHDIGYMSLDRLLMNKPLKQFSEKEFQHYQRHCTVGSELLKNIAGFEEVARIVLHHHEGFEGDGFPDGLRGENIPIGARIIAVANLYDRSLYPRGKALISSRSAAEFALREAAGHSLDSQLVDLFLEKNIPAVVAARWPEVEVSMFDLKPGLTLTRDVSNVGGIPLLKKGTVLTEHLINKLRVNEEMDVMVSRIFVARKTLENETQDSSNLEKANFSPYVRRQPKPGSLDPVMVFKNTGLGQIFSPREKPVSGVPDNSDAATLKANKELMRPVVVVVDDDPQIVNALKRELHSGGYKAVGFNEVIPTFNYLRKNDDILALIADFNMPLMRGDSFLSLVHEEFPELPYIVITGEATRENVILLGKTTHPLRILPKPWKKKELLETLGHIDRNKKPHK